MSRWIYRDPAVEAAPRIELMRREPARAFDDVRDDNGYVREAALLMLRERPSAAALERVVERLNDWVPEVRRLALRAFDDYLHERWVDALLLQLGPVLALLRKGRADHRPLVDAVVKRVSAPGVLPRTLEVYRRLPGGAALDLAERLLDAGGATEAAFMRHPEPWLRRALLARAARQLSAAADELCDAALYDRAASVRLAALRLRLGRSGPAAGAPAAGAPAAGAPASVRERCTPLLLDPSPSVRGAACVYAQAAGTDLAGFYRERLEQTAALPDAALEALLSEGARLGLREAEPLARRLLNHDWPRLRSAALLALTRLAPDEAGALAEDGLRDPSARVRRTTLRLLHGGVTLTPPVLRPILLEAAARDDVRTVEGLLRLFSPWMKLDLLLELLTAETGAMTEAFVRAQLDGWNRPATWFGLRSIERGSAERLGARLTDAALRRRLTAWPELTRNFEIHGLMRDGNEDETR